MRKRENKRERERERKRKNGELNQNGRKNIFGGNKKNKWLDDETNQ